MALNTTMIVNVIKVYIWTVCGRYMDMSWTVHGRYVDSTWTVHGRYVDGTWVPQTRSQLRIQTQPTEFATGLAGGVAPRFLAHRAASGSGMLVQPVGIANQWSVSEYYTVVHATVVDHPPETCVARHQAEGFVKWRQVATVVVPHQ